MSYPPLPSNGETSWGNKFRTWADAIEGRKVEGEGLTLRRHTGAGERVVLDHPGGTTMLYGDTGWRILTSWDSAGTVTGEPLMPGMGPITGTSGSITIRRRGSEVTLALHRVRFTGGSSVTLPIGFRSGGAAEYVILTGISLNDTVTLQGKVGSAALFITPSTTPANGDTTYRALFRFLTSTAWPEYLPGTPA